MRIVSKRASAASGSKSDPTWVFSGRAAGQSDSLKRVKASARGLTSTALTSAATSAAKRLLTPDPRHSSSTRSFGRTSKFRTKYTCSNIRLKT